MMNSRKTNLNSAKRYLLNGNMTPAAPAPISFNEDVTLEFQGSQANEQGDCPRPVGEVDDPNFSYRKLPGDFFSTEPTPAKVSKSQAVARHEPSALKVAAEVGIVLTEAVVDALGKNFSSLFSSSSKSNVWGKHKINVPEGDVTYQRFRGGDNNPINVPGDNCGDYQPAEHGSELPKPTFAQNR